MSGTIITIWVALIILPSILFLLMPLIDKILTDETIENINNVIWNIDQIIWSNWTNLLFATIWIILLLSMIRRFMSFFTWNNNQGKD